LRKKEFRLGRKDYVLQAVDEPSRHNCITIKIVTAIGV